MPSNQPQAMWEYSVLHHDKDGKATVVVKPSTVVATTKQNAELRAARDIPAEWDDKLEELTINVRLFKDDQDFR